MRQELARAYTRETSARPAPDPGRLDPGGWLGQPSCCTPSTPGCRATPLWSCSARRPRRPDDPVAAPWLDRFLFAPGLRLGGGTDEIQRNTIAERGPRPAPRTTSDQRSGLGLSRSGFAEADADGVRPQQRELLGDGVEVVVAPVLDEPQLGDAGDHGAEGQRRDLRVRPRGRPAPAFCRRRMARSARSAKCFWRFIRASLTWAS